MAIAPDFRPESPAQSGDDLHRGNNRRARHGSGLPNMTRARPFSRPPPGRATAPRPEGGRPRGGCVIIIAPEGVFRCGGFTPPRRPPTLRRKKGLANRRGPSAGRRAPCRSFRQAFPALPEHKDEFIEFFARGAGRALVFPKNREPALLQHPDRGKVVFGDVGIEGPRIPEAQEP